jgi:hypothetical protein
MTCHDLLILLNGRCGDLRHLLQQRTLALGVLAAPPQWP